MRKFLHFTTLAVLTAVAAMMTACQPSERNDSSELAFVLEVESVGANEVTVKIKHNGTEDLTYYGFCYRNFNYGETLAIENEVAGLRTSGQTPSSFLTSGSSSEITCTGLQSSTTYRFVVVGMDESLNVYGKPSSVYFDTEKGTVIYEKNEYWTVSYLGKQSTADNSVYGDAIQVISHDTQYGYFVTAVLKSEYDEKGVGTCIEEALAEREAEFAEMEEGGWLVDRSEYVNYATGGYILELDEVGAEYVGLAIGVNEEFALTGLYAESPVFTTEEVTYSDSYGRWLGEWEMIGTYNGAQATQTVTIECYVPDQVFLIRGYQIDVDETMPPFTANFNATTGVMEFRAGVVDEFYYENQAYITYFYGTRTEGSNVRILTGEYAIANAVYGVGGTATVSARTVTQDDGTSVTPTEMQFVGESPDGTSTYTHISPVPQFPFTMIKNN